MNFPLLLAETSLSGDSPVALSTAWIMGSAVVVLSVGLAESRFKIAAQEKRQDAQDAALSELRTKQQVMEVGAAEAKVLMTEVRTQLTQYGEQNREQTRMLHELLSRSEGTARRRSSDAA